MVVDTNFIKKEVLVKLLSKIFGISRMVLILYLIGFTKELDSIFLIQSIIGIVLLVNVFFELNFSKKILLSISNNDSSIYKLYWPYILFLSLVYLTISLSYFFIIGELISYYLIILIFLIASFFNIIGYLGMIELRLQDLKRKILLYYFLTSFGLLFFFIFFDSILIDKLNYYSLPLSVLATDICIIFFLFKNVFFKFIRCFKEMSLSWDKNFSKSIFIIGIFILIDSTDKFFLKSLGPGILSTFSYGLYVTITVRSILDIRSNFNAKLTLIKNDKSKLKVIFYKYLKTLIKLYSFFLFIFLVSVYFLSYFENETIQIFKLLNLELENINLLFKISLIGIIFYAPLYLIFDLTYRIYYAVDDLNYIFHVALIAFIINVVLNYIIGYYFELGAVGILLSSISVFIFLVYSGLRYINKLAL